jgi:hypothetical protein
MPCPQTRRESVGGALADCGAVRRLYRSFRTRVEWGTV